MKMVSFIIPFLNEQESLPTLLSQIDELMRGLKRPYEAILIDDGSDDKSVSEVKKLDNKSIVLLEHRQRMGKGRSLADGFSVARGEVIVFMDADLQDDPRDIPAFLAKIDEGQDLVNGWRRDRNDPINKTLPSSIFNAILLKGLLRSPFHDVNCGFKAMKRQVLEEIPLYGDNYRFLPIIAHKQGFTVDQVVVTHNPRKYGVSKYGFFRIFFGFFDTITTYFVSQFAQKPLHFFGPVGGVLGGIGLLITIELTIERLVWGVELYKRPLLLAGIFLVIVGLQIFLTGIIGELIVYVDRQRKNTQRMS